jgi:hypothetical protein
VGISEQTFYRWKKSYGGMLPSEARELKQLREENARLKRVVADLTLDKVMLQDVVQKSSEARQAARGSALLDGPLPGKRAARRRAARFCLSSIQAASTVCDRRPQQLLVSIVSATVSKSSAPLSQLAISAVTWNALSTAAYTAVIRACTIRAAADALV